MLCLSLILLCSIANAANFIEISRDEKNLLLLDISSLRDNGDYVTVWTKWVSRGENLKEKKKVFGEKYAYMLMLQAFNKNIKEMQVNYGHAYSNDGKVLHTFENAFSSYKFEPVAPGSYGEALWDMVMRLTNL